MKTRSGFVSNSSSSSFIIVGEDINIERAIKMVSTNDICAIGKYLYEGEDVIDCDEEILEFIKTNNLSSNFIFYNAYITGADSLRFNKNIIDKENVCVVSINRDHGSSKNINDITERYINEN